MTTIEPFVQRSPIILDTSATARDAARAMDAHSIGCIMVRDTRGRLIGLVTDRDITTRLTAHGGDPGQPLSSIMTPDPAVVDEHTPIEQVISLLAEKGVRRLPVVKRGTDGGARCVGIVTFDDLLASGEIDPFDIMSIVRGQAIRRIGRIRNFRAAATARTGGGHHPEAGGTGSLEQIVAFETGLPLPEARAWVLGLAEALMRRLHFTGAMYFLRLLPPYLHAELAGVRPGPDRSVRLESVLRSMHLETDLPEGVVRSYLTRTAIALEEWIGAQRFAHVRDQLPADLKSLFRGPETLDAAA